MPALSGMSLHKFVNGLGCLVSWSCLCVCLALLVQPATALSDDTPSGAAAIQGPPSPYEPQPLPEPTRDSGPSSLAKRLRDWHNTTLSWETGAGRSYLIPAVEIVGYEFLLNRYDRTFVEPQSAYRTNDETIWKHLTDSKWVIDNDQFKVNQFLHPYGGSVYYGLARSAGLETWQAFLYSAGGSFLWEIAGETTDPSINDMIATPIGGTFLGEPLFRMANLVLESGDGPPGFWRELGAAAISPPTGFNRLVFGNKFDAIYPSHQPATFMRLQVGGSISSSSHNVSSAVEENGAVADFSLIYGLPGKPGYTYRRPFDYFEFHVTAVTANTLESLNTRGLLWGREYASGQSTRGVWGVYGTYDYISPQVFRVSNTALALGTTWQTWLSQTIALQGTALGGAGYGAAGSRQRTGERDYHYGLAPEALLALRLIFGERAMIDITGREYFVSDVLSPEQNAWENILRAESAVTLRLFDRHGVALRYLVSHRDAQYAGATYRDQTVSMLSVMYVFLGETKFGAVEWR